MKYLLLFIAFATCQTLTAQLVPASKGGFSKVEFWDYSRNKKGEKFDSQVEASKIEIHFINDIGITAVDISSGYFGDETITIPIRSILKETPIADIIVYECILENKVDNQAFTAVLRGAEIMEFALWLYDEKGSAQSKIVFVK